MLVAPHSAVLKNRRKIFVTEILALGRDRQASSLKNAADTETGGAVACGGATFG